MMIGEDKRKEKRTDTMVQVKNKVVALKKAETKSKRGGHLTLESEVGFNTYAALSTDCLIIFNSELKCIELNKVALLLFPPGTKKKDVLGKHLLEISPGLDKTDKYNKCLEVLKNGTPLFEDIIIPGPKFAGACIAAGAFPVNNGLGIVIKLDTSNTEQEHIEHKILESEERYSSLVDKKNEYIYVIDDKGIVTYISTAIESVIGFRASDIIGRHISDYIYKEDLPYVLERFQNNSVSIAPQPFEFRVLTRSGEVRWLQNFSWALFKKKRFVGYRGVVTDITDRKRQNMALMESEARYRALVETMTDGLAVQDGDGILIYVNDALCEIVGYSRDELIGCTTMGILDEVNQNTFNEQMRSRRKGERTSYEIDFTRKDGSKIKVLVSPQFLYDEAGNVVGSFGIARDITESIRLGELLKVSEKRFRTIVENAPNLLVITDADGNNIYVSPNCEKIVGYTQEELMTGSIWWVYDDDMPEARELYERTFSHGVGSKNFEYKAVKKNGEVWYASSSWEPLHDSAGQFHGIVFETIDVTERKKVEEQLRQNEQFSRDIMENSPNPIVLINPDTSLRYVNTAMERLTGFSKTELINVKAPYPWWMEETAEETFEDLQVAISKGISRLEKRFKKKNGKRFWVEINTKPIRTDGKIDYCLSNWVDITERKRIEEALQESEERFRSLVENAPYMIVIADREGKILLINYTAVGFTVEDTIGTSIYDYIPIEYHDEVSRCIDSVFESGKTTAYEITGAGPEGTTSWYSTRLGPIKHDDQIIAVTLMVSDITERKKAEDDLREAQEKLRVVFDAIGEGITVVDATGTIVDVNNTVLDMKGFGREEVIGKHGLDFVAEVDRAMAVDEMMAFLKGQENRIPTTEVMLLTKDGREIPCEANCTMMRDRSGNITGFVTVERDITERKKIENDLRSYSNRLREMAAQLSLSEENVRRRLAQELHDKVGQNLTVLGINLKRISMELPAATMALLSPMIDDSKSIVEQTVEILRDVMADLHPPVMDDYGLLAALNWYADQYSSRTGVNVTIEGEEPTSRLDRSLESGLFRIYQELLTNVAKHARATQVMVNLASGRNTIRLTVTDNGTGFNVENKVYPNGYKGWGLLTMKERAESMGGSLNVESSPGRGTRILVEVQQ